MILGSLRQAATSLPYKGVSTEQHIITFNQARSQDLEKGGGYFERVRSVQTTLTRIFIDLESVQTVCPKIETKCLGKLGNSKVFSSQNQVISKKKKNRSSPKFSMIFRPKSEIQRFFPPKIRWSPKKKKNRSSPKFRMIFLPISQIQTFEGGLFSYGGGYFPFFTENRPQKHKKHAILHT